MSILKKSSVKDPIVSVMDTLLDKMDSKVQKSKPRWMDLAKPCYHCSQHGCDKCDNTGWLLLHQFEIREDVARLIEYGQELRGEK